MVAANAVKLPVTKGLDASCSGYLPIHSILQLLKSRVFSRHKVPIKVIKYKYYFRHSASFKRVKLLLNNADVVAIQLKELI